MSLGREIGQIRLFVILLPSAGEKVETRTQVITKRRFCSPRTQKIGNLKASAPKPEIFKNLKHLFLQLYVCVCVREGKQKMIPEIQEEIGALSSQLKQAHLQDCCSNPSLKWCAAIVLKVWSSITKPNKIKTITGSVEVTTSSSSILTSAPEWNSTVTTTFWRRNVELSRRSCSNTNQIFPPTGQCFKWYLVPVSPSRNFWLKFGPFLFEGLGFFSFQAQTSALENRGLKNSNQAWLII